VGVYNQFILWSSSWFPWDGAPIDTPNLWQISLCWTETSETMTGCSTGHPYQVDITPRRLQQFLINPGSKYLWENRTIKDNSLVESGTVIADKYGLVTIQHFRVASAGSRLVLKPSPVLK
jgi:hypothetical protein